MLSLLDLGLSHEFFEVNILLIKGQIVLHELSHVLVACLKTGHAIFTLIIHKILILLLERSL
tara:strand:- start:237 stop:422 length:186 start_codon:yes stop_codon:yes gene_type:complete